MPRIRVICHIDLDAFYVQVERALQRVPLGPTEPCAVVQYNAFAGGGIIALSYEAKRAGVKRNMRGDEARRICPGLKLVTVPVANEKADLTIYRDAGTQVFELLDKQGAVCERTSIDEAYIDISTLAREVLKRGAADAPSEDDLQGCHVLGISDEAVVSWVSSYADPAIATTGDAASTQPSIDTLLAAGAVVATRLRRLVKDTTGYTMSAGVAVNKLLAKHASGMHKPYQQTVVRPGAVDDLMRTVKITELNGLGGKKGEDLKRTHQLEFVADLQRFSREQLAREFPSGNSQSSFVSWLYDACRGVCHKPVERRLFMDSVGNSKTFRGPDMLRTFSAVEKYIGLLSIEIFERLQVYKTRYGVRPTLATVGLYQSTTQVTRKGTSVTVSGGEGHSASRSFQLSGELASATDLAKRATSAAKLYLEKDCQGNFALTALGLITTKMVEIPKVNIMTFFGAAAAGPVKALPSQSTNASAEPDKAQWKALANPAAIDRAELDAVDLPLGLRQEIERTLKKAPAGKSQPRLSFEALPPSTSRSADKFGDAAAASDAQVTADTDASGWVCSTCTFRNEGEGSDEWLQCSICQTERSDRCRQPVKEVPRKRGARKESASVKRKATGPATPLDAFLTKRAK